jgi:hypothetical protein
MSWRRWVARSSASPHRSNAQAILTGFKHRWILCENSRRLSDCIGASIVLSLKNSVHEQIRAKIYYQNTQLKYWEAGVTLSRACVDWESETNPWPTILTESPTWEKISITKPVMQIGIRAHGWRITLYDIFGCCMGKQSTFCPLTPRGHTVLRAMSGYVLKSVVSV